MKATMERQIYLDELLMDAIDELAREKKEMFDLAMDFDLWIKPGKLPSLTMDSSANRFYDPGEPTEVEVQNGYDDIEAWVNQAVLTIDWSEVRRKFRERVRTEIYAEIQRVEKAPFAVIRELQEQMQHTG